MDRRRASRFARRLTTLSSNAGNGGPDAEALLRQNLDPRTFDFGSVDPGYVGISISGGRRIVLNRDDMINAVKALGPHLSLWQVKDLTIMNKSSAGPFTTLTYSYAVMMKISEKEFVVKAIDQDTYELRGGALKLVFGIHTEERTQNL